MEKENPEAFAAMEKELDDFDIKDDPEAMAAMERELAKLDVDPHELSPEQLKNLFILWSSRKEAGLMTNRGTQIPFDQKKFDDRFDVTGDGKFDLEDVKAFGDKTIPYGIYFGSTLTGGFSDKDVSSATSKVQVISCSCSF